MQRLASALLLAFALAIGAPAQAGGEIGGTYGADLPSASGCGRRILLDLYADGTYLFVQRYLCRPWSNAQLETGDWTADAGGVVLKAQGRETRFTHEPDALRYVGKGFGRVGLTLTRMR